MPLLHGSALGLQESAPVCGLRRPRGELPNNDAAHKVIAALHVVAINWMGGLENKRRTKPKIKDAFMIYVMFVATQNVIMT